MPGFSYLEMLERSDGLNFEFTTTVSKIVTDLRIRRWKKKKKKKISSQKL